MKTITFCMKLLIKNSTQQMFAWKKLKNKINKDNDTKNTKNKDEDENENENEDEVPLLTEDGWLAIIDSLSNPSDVLSLGLVCKALHKLSCTNFVWQRFITRQQRYEEDMPLPPNISPRIYYLRKYHHAVLALSKKKKVR